MLLIGINVYLTLNFKPLADYQNFSGCFVYYKPYSIVALLINLITSVLGGKWLGVSGVFLGTTITYSFMNITVACIIYKYIFEEKVTDYFKRALINGLPLIVSFFILYFFSKRILISSYVLDFIVKFVLVTVVYGLCFVLILHKNEDYRYFKQYSFSLLEKYKRKIFRDKR